MVAWESLLERDALVLFELSPGIISFSEQPTVEVYYDGAEQKKYFPDFALTLRNEHIVHVEVKPASKLLRDQVAYRYGLIAEQHKRQRRHFWLLTDKEIRREPRLSNLKLLAYHRRRLPSSNELYNLQKAIQIIAPATLDKVASLIGGIHIAYELLAYGYLTCDLDLPICDRTLLHLAQKGTNDDSLYL